MTMPDFSHAIIREDQIDFALYEHETEAKQKVKPASMWIQELIDRLRNPVKQPRALMPWRKTHKLMQFRPGEVTVWGGANGSGKSLVTGQIALSLCTQGEKVCIASFEMKPLKSLERMGRQWSTFNADEPAFRGDEKAIAQFVDVYEQFRDWTMSKLAESGAVFRTFYPDAPVAALIEASTSFVVKTLESSSSTRSHASMDSRIIASGG